MTKYNRITGKVFGGNANATGDNPEIGQFGSAKDGSYIGTSDISSIQALPAWGKGWVGAVTPETNFPPLPEMTGAMKVLSEQQCYLLQQGVPEWDNATIYYKNCFSSKNGKIYISQSDTNQGNDPETDTVNWKEFSQDKANKDLDNLTEAGEKHFLNKSQITNCLLEVPQRIKLELNDGVLTLKAGSQVIVPNGFEADGTTPKFDYVDIVSDVTVAPPYANEPIFIYYRNNGTEQAVNNAQCSGTSSTIGYGYWYDTTNNLVNRVNSAEVAYSGVSLPLAIIKASNGSWVSIDQVFNGMGYIGSTAWVDKGVKGLIPNGRNEDGSLRNTELVVTNVRTYTIPSGAYNNCGYFVITPYVNTWWADVHFGGNRPAGQNWRRWYDEDNNYWWEYVSGWHPIEALIISNFVVTGGAISNYNPKTAFHAVDYNDFANTPHIIDTYINGNSWYRVYSDGWCEQGGYTEFRYNTPVTLLRNYTNTNWSIQATPSTDTGEAVSIQIIRKTTSNFTPRPQRGTGNGANQNGYWYACGY